MSLALDTPARSSLGSRILHATPVLGALARDIARDFGGDLVLAPSPLGGAAFQLTLRRA